MRLRLRIESPSGETSELVAAGRTVALGRDASCELPFDEQKYPMVSGWHARIEQTTAGLGLTHLSHSNKTLLNGHAISGTVPLQLGDAIRLSFGGPTIRILAVDWTESETPTPFASESGETVAAQAERLALLRGTAVAAQRYEIGNGGVFGRDPAHAQFLLIHPQVSRAHARLTVSGERVSLLDLGSANGTFVNGRRLAKSTLLQPGDRIDIGPFALEFDGTALVSRSRVNNIELVSHSVTRVVTDRANGQPLKLLDGVTLVIKPREFVCLLGPSGSGKSTLMTILSGRNRPSSGSVEVNGRDLHVHFEAIKQDVAIVPQKDVLHDSLAVATALRFTAELRLPSDTSQTEIGTSVDDILSVVGLTHRRSNRIRDLSGGQLKRASLANELMSRPSLLFLDEVTSGLDEQTDREMMELFRQVAEGGKTVVCITHNLANVEATCHLVVILTEGGRLAFMGTPDEAKAYFGIARLGDVYKKLAEKKPDEWKAEFEANNLFEKYVRSRLPHGTVVQPSAPAARAEPAHIAWVRQMGILTRRYLAIWRGDRLALFAMLGQSLMVALLLGVLFGDLTTLENRPDKPDRTLRTINLLFLLNVSCFWLGCNNAAKELVKERTIFVRERNFNLRSDSYYWSKAIVLGAIAMAQVLVLYGIVRIWCRPEGSAFLQWVTLCAGAAAGTALGLLISAFSRTEEVAAAMVPIAVIPQIILTGVIAPLGGLSKAIAVSTVTSYWIEQALEGTLPEETLKMIGREPPSVVSSLLAVAGYAAVFAVATLVRLIADKRN